ncbi:hypothetical protein ELI41_32000 (plasmid) [Rhizobium leguminosarum]|jgi:hypothetical protein|uniref:Uncharacterized protein n=1 Tax=Rhizobium leguminosarum TaxID=384 RepID=A0ABD7PK89_RHILE|nr:hypothetical protein [Rhizobium leguminosarum]TAU79593.1 hypothetical protein ELI41_32000 [Rhizobium leguminosarum]TAV64719.1 hypothetical protein ELI28_28110 [Rhizobium leguminosarum]TAV65177.1 hypothetical protein ELI27_30645 [Rhizobium leguminosarum]TAW25166.1 hypothetical protein ELI19_27355 [Rhizobium leguminosarum]TAW38937.1 hypothetical protein ELI18_27325 [Rhizobium leguminosarum]
MSEVLKDPLIRQMLRADNMSLGAFAQLLETAANDLDRKLAASSLTSQGKWPIPPGQEYQSVA